MIGGILLLIVALVIYFTPMLIAIDRDHPQMGPIAVINIFLGWTLVGWVVALAWSVATLPPAPPARTSPTP